MSDLSEVALKVLIVDDDQDILDAISILLGDQGAGMEFNIKTAINGELALNIVKKEEAAGKPFDLLLFDLQMPMLNGVELSNAVRALGCEVPIILISGYFYQFDITGITNCFVLDKPFEGSALIHLLKIIFH